MLFAVSSDCSDSGQCTRPVIDLSRSPTRFDAVFEATFLQAYDLGKAYVRESRPPAAASSNPSSLAMHSRSSTESHGPSC